MTADRRYALFTATLCVCLVASNLFEAKIFTVGPVTLTGGFLVFPISYIIGDILSEIYGYRSSRSAIVLAFALNAAFILVSRAVCALPAAPYCDAQPHLDYLFRSDLRISIASMAAFLCGSLLNARVMTAMKSRQGERGFGWRAVLSSLAGEAADSLVFFPIAFFDVGLGNLLTLMLTQILLKTAYEVIVLPVTYSIVKRLKR